MATLDFSEDKTDLNGRAGLHDVHALVDQSSLGTRTRDGLYEVKDWEFSKEEKDNTEDIISRALNPKSAATSAPSSSLGTLGSIFARLTGSKVLTQEDLRPVLEAMKQHLMKKNVAKDTAEKVCEGVGESLVGKKVGGFQSAFLFNLHRQPRTEFVCRSNECGRPSGARHLSHTYPHPQDFYRLIVVHQGEAVFAFALHPAKTPVYHRIRRRERCWQEHESI
jgi:hypothetical protein